MIRVLIVDDHTIVRSAFKRLIEEDKSMTVIGELSSGEEVVQTAKELEPDVIIMDINMPGIGGLEATRRLSLSYPKAKILVVSAHTEGLFPKRLLDFGIAGYLSKQSDPKHLCEAIHTVHEGKNYFDEALMGDIAAAKIGAGETDLFDALSDRELQIILMVARGINVNEIAKKLFLAEKTINGHRRKAFEKLGVETDVDATKLLIKRGLIEPDSQWH
ncbi:MAG: response regulator [Gammaproteobacteria bacterium]